MAYLSRQCMILVLQSVLLLQAGCSSFEPRPIKTNNKREGPGLFSGEKGYFEPDVFSFSKPKPKSDEPERAPLDLPPDYDLRAPEKSA